MRGYYGIGIEKNKFECNIGSLWRSAFNFGAAFIFTIGKRYKSQKSDTTKTWRSIPLYEYSSLEEFKKSLPRQCTITGVECNAGGHTLFNWCHPERTIYLLGSEDSGLSRDALNLCNSIIYIPTPLSINVSVAGSIIMYDRINKGSKNEKTLTI